ncbi:MAG: group II intron reverse transcriptase/maturase [Candidatus Binataceae bacterium]
MTNGKVRSGDDHLMEQVVARGNVKAALARVRENRGSPGVDGMTVEELPQCLMERWSGVREQLLGGTYQPKPVRRQEIPKSGGGMRELGIPCVLDRLIQQAILQVLQPLFDPSFSEHSFGFRPGRSAHDAVLSAQRYVREGRRWVVDVDLEKFFDRVNHDVLMGRLARRVGDSRLLRLIRRYLKAGMMANGVVVERLEGTPQGGPLSPLLANLLLDEVDKELEKRGHAFVRYADDCNVYVRSKRAGERVMTALERLYARLRLRVNREKSAVAPVSKRSLLGFSFWYGKGGAVMRRVAPKATAMLRQRVRQITRRSGGRSLRTVVAELRSYLPGWKQYFQLADTPGAFADHDKWIRHRLRALQLKQWKRGPKIYTELRRLGLPHVAAAEAAVTGRRWWYRAAKLVQTGLTIRYYDRLGVPRLAD